MDNKKDIKNVIKIFKKYPPLTSRLYCQLRFLKFCITKKLVYNFLKKRKFKYNKQTYFIKKFFVPFYFSC
jgi:hypothetical protein